MSEVPVHVIDYEGLVWRVVRDGGMATRADFTGITSIGIDTLRQTRGPLLFFDALAYRAEAASPAGEAVYLGSSVEDAFYEAQRRWRSRRDSDPKRLSVHDLVEQAFAAHGLRIEVEAASPAALDVAAEVAYEMKVFLYGAKSAPPVAPGWLAQIEKWRARLTEPSEESGE